MDAIGKKSLEIYGGKYWKGVDINTTLKVRSGDILLFRWVAVRECPGFEYQMVSMSSMRSADEASSSVDAGMSQ